MTKRPFLLFVLAFFVLVVLGLPRRAGASGAAGAEGQDKPEAVSLLGRELYARPAAADIPKLESALREAAAKLELSPDSPEAVIGYGRALAALWRYREAIEVYTKGIAAHPEYAMLYRHRGHRYITCRDFGRAVDDLTKAAALDDHDYDIWYHLGLARYLRGEFDRAVTAYRSCLAAALNPASRVAVSHWLYMTLRRLDEKAEAAKLLEGVTPGTEAGENKPYLSLLLFYKGLKSESELEAEAAASDLDGATIGYGLANWHLYSGDGDKAVAGFRKILALPYWPAFGFIAAENELFRLKLKATAD
jgi:tetratricopeptide (TPR) repeat protein